MKNNINVTKSLAISVLVHVFALILIAYGLSDSTHNDTDKKQSQKSKFDVTLVSDENSTDTVSKSKDGSSTLKNEDNYGNESRQVIEKNDEIVSNDTINKQSSFIGLGVQLSQEPTFITANGNRYKGVKVEKVFSGYSANQAGILSGDIILRVNGQKLTDSSSGGSLEFFEPQEVLVEVLRNNNVLTYRVNVGQVLVSNVRE